MNPNINTQALVRQIVARVRCGVCNHHFGMSDVHVLGRRENAWAFRVRCRECRTEALMLAFVGNGGAQPIYTDLVPSEWDRFKASPPISEDDVIAVHRYIQAYVGDFTELLDEPLPPE
ncbi:MAG: hypothetical protein HY868_24785 [Chloroflexi bacterium]|nr:hypothetical protein [Chloroflexota bacterium]